MYICVLNTLGIIYQYVTLPSFYFLVLLRLMDITRIGTEENIRNQKYDTGAVRWVFFK